MSQKDALALCIGMLNAFAGVIAAAPVGEIPYGARLIALAVVAACGFGLMFVDKIGKPPEEKPLAKARRRSPAAMADDFMEMAPADRVKFMSRVQKIREDEAGAPPRP